MGRLGFGSECDAGEFRSMLHPTSGIALQQPAGGASYRVLDTSGIVLQIRNLFMSLPALILHRVHMYWGFNSGVVGRI